MKNYKVVEETRQVEDKKYVDLVCYFGDKRFILVPLSKSVKAKAYFYAMLKGQAHN